MTGIFDYRGQHVNLTTADDQAFKGIVCSLDENTGKIVLKNASTNDSKLPGLQYFYASNIKELSLVNGFQVTGTSDIPANGRQKIHKQLRGRRGDRSRPHLQGLLRFDSDQLVWSHCQGEDSGDQGIGSGEDVESFKDFYEVENYTMFCQTCDTFRDSISHLMEQSKIAMTFFGTDIDRKGTLSLIQVATKEFIFMYDILSLGQEGFLDGLQAVLESKEVTKIIHDCRMVSDLLYHQFKVSLANVFDTQVASVFAFRSSNDGDWPRFVESLPGVLMSHLGLYSEDVHHFFVRERLKQKDEEVWLQRPLCSELLQNSLKNLVRMITLYQTLHNKMMTEFCVGVQLYLNHARNAPKDRVNTYRCLSHLLPFVFQDLPKVASYYSSKDRVMSVQPQLRYDSHGFRDICPRKGYSMVTTSKDSIWHSKSFFCQASCKCGANNSTKSVSHDRSCLKIDRPDPNILESGVGGEKMRPSYSTPCRPTHENMTSCPEHTHMNTTDIDGNCNILKSRSPLLTVDEKKGRERTEEMDYISSGPTYLNSKHLASSSKSKKHLQTPQGKLISPTLHFSGSKSEDDLSLCALSVSTMTGQTHADFSDANSDQLLPVKRSALMRLFPPFTSPTTPSCSKSDLDIGTKGLGEDTALCPGKDSVDADELFEIEKVKRILHQARLGYSKSGAKNRLLPSPK